jgi:RNase H-fold protein (predicted Holliday junction resolvase)
MARRSKVYLGIDPGTANTGFAVCIRNKKNEIVPLRLEYMSTKSDLPLRERYDRIRKRIRELIGEYGVCAVICEAYEVRGYGGHQNSGVSMSKLINEISEEVFECGVLFKLSSPSVKKQYKRTNLPQSVVAELDKRPKTHKEHLTDAYIHVFHHIKCSMGRSQSGNK